MFTDNMTYTEPVQFVPITIHVALSSPRPTIIVQHQQQHPGHAGGIIIIIGAILSAAHSDSSCVPVEVKNVRIQCTSLHYYTIGLTNQCYSSVHDPQAYEEFQPKQTRPPTSSTAES